MPDFVSKKVDLKYPAAVSRLPLNPDTAAEALGDWVRAGFAAVSARPTPLPEDRISFYPSDAGRGGVVLLPFASHVMRRTASAGRPQVDRNAEEGTTLLGELSLWSWIYVVSRDEGVKAIYGQSDVPTDEACMSLLDEAYAFLNDMLAQLSEFNAPKVRREAQALRARLSSGTQTYEFGAIDYILVAKAPLDNYAIGPNSCLRRVEGHWAEERFEKAAEIPPNRWAVTVRTTRPWKPGLYYDQFYQEEDEDEDSKLEAALVLLRLIRPEPHLLLDRYRISVDGHREPTKFASISRRLWKASNKAHGWRQLRQRELTDLQIIGQLLENKDSIPGLTSKNASARFDLALSRYSWSQSVSKRSWQDRVVDLAIVVETLFSRDEKQEIQHKAATRAALLLGKNASESNRIFSTIKKIYGLRSKIVHGSTSHGDDASSVIKAWRGPATVPADVETHGDLAAQASAELVSQALLALLRLEASRVERPFANGFEQKLDELAFDSRARRALQREAGITRTAARETGP